MSTPQASRSRVEICQGDMLKFRCERSPTCVVMYMLPDHYDTLEVLLREYMLMGAKILVYTWSLKGDYWTHRLVQHGPRWWMYHDVACQVVKNSGLIAPS